MPHLRRLRALREDDALTIAAMIAGDAEHKAKGMTADFFYPEKEGGILLPKPERISVCYEDDQGPVFYLRIDVEPPVTVRLHVQFDNSPLMAYRTAIMLKWAIRNLVDRYLKPTICQRIVFESITESLRSFCQKCGFQPVEGTADMALTLDTVPTELT